MNWLVRWITALVLLVAAFSAAGQALLSPPTAQVFDGGFIHAIAVQPDGKVVIGGKFSNIGGVTRNNIARMNADGTLDASWNPDANDEVLAIAINGNGDVYVGGRFTSIGGQARNRLARISPATGQADATWNPDIECHPGLCPTWLVRALALDRSGNIYVGGFFSNVGIYEFNNLARVSTAGSGVADQFWYPDPCCGEIAALVMGASAGIYVAGNYTTISNQNRSYLTLVSLDIPPIPEGELQNPPPVVDATWNPAPNGPVWTMLLDGASLYAGGSFTTLGGQALSGLARLSAVGNGAPDASWTPNANGSVFGIALDGSGNLFAAGDFGGIGGQPRKSIAKLTTGGAGEADGAFNAGAGASAVIAAVGASTSGSVYAGGLFQAIGGQLRGGFATLNAASGAPLPGPLVIGAPGVVHALAQDGSGRTVIGGAFMAVGTAGATTPRMNLARFNADGSLDGAWDPGANETVFALATDTTGDVFAGGTFSVVGGQPRSFLAKISGSGAGGVDFIWNPAPNSVVYALLATGGNLYAGGEFGTMGRGSRNFIAKVSGIDTGALDETWNANANGAVRALAHDGASLYAGGNFTAIGGQARNFVARLDGAAAADGWNPGPNGLVRAIALDGTGAAFIAGGFTNVGGAGRTGLAKVLGNGAVDAAWNPSPDGSVLAVSATGGAVYPGGTFANIGGRARTNLAKLAATGAGAAELTWDAKVNGAVRAVLATPAQNVFIGGSFTKVANADRAGYAALGPVVVSDTFPPNCQVPAGWSKPGAAASGWGVAIDFVKSGSCSLKSNPVGNNAAAEIQYTANFQAGTVSFARRVSSEQDFDCLKFYIDNVQQNIGGACSSGGLGISGEVGFGNTNVSFPLSAGTHTLRWSYQKDFSLGLGGDAAWIDEVVLPPNTPTGAPQTITFPQAPDKFFGEPPFVLNATASSGLAVSYSSLTPSICGVSGSTATLLAGGTCTIAADQAGDATFAPAATVTMSFTVLQANQTITFAPIPNKAANDPPFAVSATASSGLSVMLTVTTPGVCSLSGSTVSILSVGTCSIDANQAGNGNYNPAPTVTQSFTIGMSNQTITFNALPNKSFGDPPFGLSATASSGLPVTFSTTTPGVCSLSGSTVTILAVGSCVISANQAGNATYNPAPTVTRNFTVFKGNQTISFPPIPSHVFTDPPFTITVTASSGLPVTVLSATPGICTISGFTVTLVTGGTCTLTASQNGDATWNSAPQVQQSFFVTSNSQTIAFDPLPPRTFGEPPFAVSATASSGLPVVFSTLTTAVCTTSGVNGATVTIVGGGTCTIDANQPGDATYGAAPQVSQSFAVSKLGQSITFNPLPNRLANDPPSTLSATATSGLAVVFSTASAGVCGVSGTTLTILGPGTCTVDANQPGNAGYNPAPQVSQSFTVAKADQTITFGALSNKSFGDPPFALAATASSGLAVAFSTTTTTVCTLAGSTVTIVAPGTCTIDANQAGNAIYNPAPQVSRTFTVAKANQTITFAALANKAFGDPPFNVSATASSGLAVAFSSTTTAACTLAGNTVTIVAPGTCTIDANQAGNANFNAAPTVSRSFTVTKASQTITFGALQARAVNDPNFAISATASSGLTVAFTSLTGPVCAVVAGPAVDLLAEGTCTIAANQAGNTNYNAAPQVTQSFPVGPPNTSAVTVTKAGTGSGTVVSTAGSPGSINCGSACSGNFANNSSVTLQETPAAGSVFAGWGGACGGTATTCTVNVPLAGGSQSVTASFTQLTNTITVNKSGAGTGTVTSTPAGIDCGATCQGTFNVASSVTLTATAPTGSIFTGWTGACAAFGTNATCTIADMPNSAQVVGASFGIDTRTVTVTKTGLGNGSVSSAPAGINACSSTCNAPFTVGSSVTLTATLGANSVFNGWSGVACNGGNSATTCTFTVSAATTVTAAFSIQTAQLTVLKAGAGSGTVTSTPAGINCGATCSTTFNVGTSITLTAAPQSPGSTFAGWTGVSCAGGNSGASCTFAFNAAATATATFNVAQAPLTVTRAGNGTGSVASTPAGITCGATCTANFNVGSSVLLSATPSPGSAFTGWSGGAVCVGTGPCSVTVNNPTTVTATFAIVTHVLTVAKAGAGTGTVSSAPVGINCGATCSASFNETSTVTLTATPAAGMTFQGWSGGGCSGTGQCVVTISAAQTVTANFALGTLNLTVNRTGAGSGTVTSAPAGINCGATCAANFTTNSTVTLTAAASPGSVFQGWSGGGCSGTGQCAVTMSAVTTVTANFVPEFTLTVARTGVGTGTVTSAPAGINCGSTCAFTFSSGANVTLTATPGVGSLFTGWSGGGCSGTGTCTVTMNTALTVTATFAPSSFSLTVNRAGPGTGTVTSSPAGINCGATCAASFSPGASVTLTATPAPGSVFDGWSGPCAGNGTCQVTLNAATSVTATFSVSNPPRLVNIATRGLVITGNDVMIGGFIIAGAAAKTVVITGKGPSLAQFGIANALANPTLTLVRQADQSTVTVNDDWGTAGNAAQLQALGFAPSHPLEAAVLATLPPGAYTAILSGVNNGTGVGLVEVFEIDQPDVQLINISTRGKVNAGNDAMIGGFVVSGTGPQEVIITAKGPSLAAFGVPDTLSNPQLTLVRASDGATIGFNDNWVNATNAAEIQASGFAPSNPFEAAILITLPPGAYTAIITGSGGSSGTAIIEVFAL